VSRDPAGADDSFIQESSALARLQSFLPANHRVRAIEPTQAIVVDYPLRDSLAGISLRSD
jgi:hypothetical protein